MNEDEMAKDEEIKRLEAEILSKEASLLEDNIKFIKSINPEISDETAKDKAIQFINVLKDATKKSTELQASLDACDTIEDISNWRKKYEF